MLELKQTQRLSPVLTQQLQQAIKLLQLSKLELTDAIEQEIKENPILEVSEETPEGPVTGIVAGIVAGNGGRKRG